MVDKLFSDEAETCEDCLAQGYRIEHGTIRDPGKFEAEPLAAFHAYHVMLDGGADDDDGPAWRVGNVVCEETEQGFVNSEIHDTEADAIKAWESAPADELAEEDTICECYHWHEEHDADGECFAPNCECKAFTYSEANSTPEAIADRGGDPALWPQRVKDALTQ